MSNSGKVWDIREAYKQQRNNAWSRGDIGVSSDSSSATVNKIQISTTGNASAFGDITVAGNSNGGAMGGSPTRLLFGGGNQPDTSNIICYKEFSADSNFADFGDLSVDRQMLTGASDGLRTVFAGGRQADGGPFTTSNRMDVSTFASLGNAVDFGDLTVARFGAGSMQSPTRAVFAGGGDPANVIDYVTFASLGNAVDFGDIGTSTTYAYFGGSSSETRGVFGGGGNPSNPSIINFITMASTGNSQDFGDLTVNRITMSAAGNSNRVCFFSGQQNVPGGPGTNVIDFVTIATTGNASDFGDATGNLGFKTGGHSNGHGGIVLGELQRPSVTYMPGSGRGFTNAGSTTGGAAGSTNTIEMIFVPTLGNALDFGDLTVARQLPSSTNSITRSCVAGGESPGGIINTIDCYEMQSLGNASDFGDLTVTRRSFQNGGTNGSRGTFHGGNTPSVSDVIDYITIASAGNATDFGNLTVARDGAGTLSSPTRTVTGGGYAGGDLNVIDYITTASTGNATDFGDLTVARYHLSPVSSTTRGVWIAGYAPGIGSTRTDVMDYVTIASTGNATDFGDLAQARAAGAGISNNIRGVYSGGEVPGAATDQIEFITIATTGNSSDFGNLTTAKQYVTGTCDANSGLQSA
jgi:hypothetical protein